jgi:putative membrane protein
MGSKSGKWYNKGSMNKVQKQFLQFLVRWLLNSLGIWVAIRLIGSIHYSGGLFEIIFAGLILSVINAVIKPILIILSLPMIVVTLGLFMLIVNGMSVYIAAILSPGLNMGFGSAILAGMVIGLINYALTHMFDLVR